MANTYYKMYIQTVFPVKYRKAMINELWRPGLQAVIGKLINETGCKTIIVNGVEDHIHCFFSLKPSVSLSEVMRSVKAKSSMWINESGFIEHRFEWQTGYGAFSYSKSQMDSVYQYIKSQEEHHKHMSFRDEYLKMLKKF
ncbi:MAG: IS200/IS605 family transposase [Balneolaceae bacterium]|nr:IS200/IS605 family transposase [Balneolaceae bacterium]